MTGLKRALAPRNRQGLVTNGTIGTASLQGASLSQLVYRAKHPSTSLMYILKRCQPSVHRPGPKNHCSNSTTTSFHPSRLLPREKNVMAIPPPNSVPTDHVPLNDDDLASLGRRTLWYRCFSDYARSVATALRADIAMSYIVSCRDPQG